jgi:hypothetical protein
MMLVDVEKALEEKFILVLNIYLSIFRGFSFSLNKQAIN